MECRNTDELWRLHQQRSSFPTGRNRRALRARADRSLRSLCVKRSVHSIVLAALAHLFPSDPGLRPTKPGSKEERSWGHGLRSVEPLPHPERRQVALTMAEHAT